MGKNAVIFGAGKLGRGFLGKKLHDQGYFLAFIEEDEELFKTLLTERKYVVQDPRNGELQEIPVSDGALTLDAKNVGRIVDNADVVFTAVGEENLERLVAPLAAPLAFRARVRKQINVIVCEGEKPAKALSEAVLQYLGNYFDKKLEAHIFVNSRVGFVPTLIDANVREEDGILLAIPYSELLVDRDNWMGGEQIPGIDYVHRLEPHAIRQQYAFPAARATLGFMAQRYGHETTTAAFENADIVKTVHGQVEELLAAIDCKFKLDFGELEPYKARTLQRLLSEKETKPLTTDPEQKLARDGPLVGAALYVLKHGENPPSQLARGIAAALRNKNPDDPRSIEMRATLEAEGIRKAAERYCGLNPKERLDEKILTLVYTQDKWLKRNQADY